MVKLAILTNWIDSAGIYDLWKRQSKDGAGRWNDVQLVPCAKDADMLILINAPAPNTDFRSFNKPVLYFLMEPYIPSHWGIDPVRDFIASDVYTHDKHHNIGEWHIARTWTELSQANFNGKYDYISTIQSTKNYDLGHKLRLAFIQELNRAVDVLHCYGSFYTPELKHYKGLLPPGNKECGLRRYKYHLAVENHAIDNYFTEKIIDGILEECLVFYWGCPNLESYLPARAFIRLSLTNTARDIETIMQAIKRDEWRARLDDIRRAKSIILNELQFFPMIEKILKTRGTINERAPN